MKWVFRRHGQCDIDALAVFYAKLFLVIAVTAALLAGVFAAGILNEWQSRVVAIASIVVLSTCFVPTYIYLLKDERYFRRNSVNSDSED
jgi:hypothetical protein